MRRRAVVALLGVLALAACAGQAGVPAQMQLWNRPFPPYRVMAMR